MANNRELSQLGSIIVVDDSSRNLGIGTTDPNAVVGAGNTAKLSVGIVSAYQLFGDGSNLSGLTPSQVGALENVVEDTEPQLGGDLDVNGNNITGTGNVNLTGIITATTFSGSGSSLTNIPNSALDNSTVSYGGVQVSLGGTDATPAFDLTDAINYPYSSLTGITTEIVGDTTPQLGGDLDVNNNNITGTGNVNLIGIVTATTFSGSGASLTNIPNAALDNSTVSYGGVSLSLGGTDTTPAFDLQDATNYPYTSLTGITTEIAGDTTPQLGGDLDVNNNNITGTGNVNLIGIVTATSFTGNLAGTATTATALETARNFEITGDVTASAISFDGTGNVSLAATIQPNSVELGTDTTGDYVASISGTANQIAVDVTSGEGTTPVISIPDNPTLPGTTVTIQNDLEVNRNLNVTGNITVGGTSATLFTQTLSVADADLILGVRTDANGVDISTDTTASHGGIAIASTEGTPLVTLVNPGAGETLPATYKKIMWFEQGSFSGLGTDAWLINYGVGIGSTQVPNNVVLAAGDVHITNNDIKKVRDINASGIVTATSFVKASNSSGFLKADGTEDTNTYLTAESDTLDSITGRGSTTTNDVSVGIITATKFVGDLTGTATTATNADLINIQTQSSDDNVYYIPFETGTGYTSLYVDSALQYNPGQDLLTFTNVQGDNISLNYNLDVTGISTLGGVKISSGIITASSGIVTYYGDGTYLSNIAPAGAIEGLIVIDQSGNTVGTSGSVTTLSFEGSTGVTVTATSGAAGIATVLIEGGGDAATLDGLDSTSFLRSDAADTKTSGNLIFSDGVSARFGDGEDLVIWHNSAHSYIAHQGTGNLNIRNSNDDADIIIESDDGSGGSANYFLADGSTGEAILYHYGTEKLATKPGGVYVSGIITATSGFATTNGTSSQFLKADGSVDSSTYLTTETNDLSSVVTWANVPDTNITQSSVTQHQAALSITESQISDLQSYLTTESQTLDDVVGLGSDTTQTITVGTATTGVVVRPDGTLNVSGISTIGNIEINANTIESTNVHGSLVLAAKGNLQLRVNSASSNLALVGNSGGSVDLYYNNAKTFETAAEGIIVTGIVTATSGFATTNGTSSQFLKADGSVDSSTYLTAESDTLDSVTTRGSTTTNDISVGIITATKFVKSSNSGGFLKADGVEDTNTYLTSETQTLDDVVGLGSDTTQTITVGTATTGVVVRPDGTLNVSGVSTFQDNVHLGDSVILKLGDDGDLQLRHAGTTSEIRQTQSGTLRITNGGTTKITNSTGLQDRAIFNQTSVELFYDDSKKFETTGIGVSVSSGAGLTATIAGPSNLIIDPMPAGVGTTSGIVRIKGDLYVDGTTTQINSTSIELADFVVGIATTATSDLLADGAGIEIGPNNTFKYLYNGGTNPSLKSSENINLAEGKAYQINQSSVLNSTTLGSGVTNSSLTALGTITTGTWQGSAINDDYIGTIDNADMVSLSALDIDGGTAITSLSDDDLFIVDDGGNGINRKITASNAKTYFSAGAGGGGGGLWSEAGVGIHTLSSVGIGTTNPQSKLEVNVGTAVSAFDIQGSAGQLFSVTNNLTSGSIFSVNDVSGIPSIDVDADGTIQLAPFGSTEFVGVGITNPSAKLDINGTLNVSGISTFGDELHVGYQKEIYFNNNSVYNAFQISQNGSTQSLIKNNVSSGNILIATGNAGSGYVQITNALGGETAAKFTPGGSTELHHDGSKKLETAGGGVIVTGIVTATDFNSTSDARLKTNVQVIDDPLAKVLQINGVSFNWIENNKPSMGVIADNIEEVLPELVSDTDPKTVNYNGLIGLLIEVVKEQQTQIDSLNERLSRLE